MNIDYYEHTVACREYLGEDSRGASPKFCQTFMEMTLFAKKNLKINLKKIGFGLY